MAAQAETTVNMFHSPDRDMALQSEKRFGRAETLPRNDDRALQALASFESLSCDAIESFAAEMLDLAIDRCRRFSSTENPIGTNVRAPLRRSGCDRCR